MEMVTYKVTRTTTYIVKVPGNLPDHARWAAAKEQTKMGEAFVDERYDYERVTTRNNAVASS